MNRRLRNAVRVTLVGSASSLALGTATAHADVEPRPVSPVPVLLQPPAGHGVDLVITKTTSNSVTIKNDGPLATSSAVADPYFAGEFAVVVYQGERQGDPFKCTKWTFVPQVSVRVPGLGPYGSVTLPIPWATNERGAYVDGGDWVWERNEWNNSGTIPASDDLRPSQCSLAQ